MKHYTLFGIAILGLGTWISLSSPEARSADEKTKGHEGHAAQFLTCAKACAACQVACDSCAAHCAGMVAEGNKRHMTTLRTCQDCADICRTAAASSARGGPFVKEICEACAKVCDGCGKACGQFPDDKHMSDCAKACKDCAAACREMLTHL
jgi:hypothetical protein